jgi:hypothetical protein
MKTFILCCITLVSLSCNSYLSQEKLPADYSNARDLDKLYLELFIGDSFFAIGGVGGWLPIFYINRNKADYYESKVMNQDSFTNVSNGLFWVFSRIHSTYNVKAKDNDSVMVFIADNISEEIDTNNLTTIFKRVGYTSIAIHKIESSSLQIIDRDSKSKSLSANITTLLVYDKKRKMFKMQKYIIKK